jgi:hypothetical protein
MMTKAVWLLPILFIVMCVGLLFFPSQASSSRNGFSGSPYQVGPITTTTSTLPEQEELINIDPNTSANFVSAVTDFSVRAGAGTTKYVYSNDKGASWTESFVPLSGIYPITGDGVAWNENRDPSIAIDHEDNVYLAGIYQVLAGGQPQNDNPAAGVYVCQSTLPTVSFASADCHPVTTYTAPGNNPYTEDKVSIATDNSSSSSAGNVYAAWVHYINCNGPFNCKSKFIAFSRSTDHGVSWSPFVQISRPNTNVQWPELTVGSDGSVYVAYETLVSANTGRHWLAISSNGGVTFTPAQSITPVYNELTFSSTYRKNSGPGIMVSPVPGAEYVYDVFGVQGNRSSNVDFVRSRSPKGLGGFTQPVAMNDTTIGQRLFPAAALDNNGALHVAWLDTRNSRTVAMYDVYATYSTNLGGSFAPNARVTPTLISSQNSSFIGDYMGIIAEPVSGVAHPVWSNGTLQTTTLTIP